MLLVLVTTTLVIVHVIDVDVVNFDGNRVFVILVANGMLLQQKIMLLLERMLGEGSWLPYIVI